MSLVGEDTAERKVVAPSEHRERARVCMRELFTGNLQITPLLFASLYAYISGGARDQCPKRDARACIGRGIDLLNDLMEMVHDDSPTGPTAESPQTAESWRQLSMHACMFGVGTCVRDNALAPAALWCAGYFFVLRGYAAGGAWARALIPNMHARLEQLKWTLSIIFFCMDAPEWDGTRRSRLFAHFACGTLAYHMLFTPLSRTTLAIHLAACIFDAVHESIFSYCVLALRLLDA